jgi:hypothetical protein
MKVIWRTHLAIEFPAYSSCSEMVKLFSWQPQTYFLLFALILFAKMFLLPEHLSAKQPGPPQARHLADSHNAGI